MNKNLRVPVGIFGIFLIIAITLTYTLNNLFYLVNFLYIGSILSIGIYLFVINNKYGRHLVQFTIGLYMVIFLGIILQENMQLSGFFYYLFLGVFQAAVIHYAIAKIFGPVLFGRGWCGYACWTGMVLDILPFKTPKNHERVKNLGLLRYMIFILIFIGVLILFYLNVPNLDYLMFIIFILGNLIYYAVGIVSAYILKDNRAFCKYFCPITTFLKPASYFSLLRVKNTSEKCIKCNKCINNCPMDVDMLDNRRKRKNGTECILCLECISNCPTKSLKI
ncbi:putative electron transport protein YccM [Methanobrevibacter cuticularis]|uniref:Putative electron transport protein YccM n=1 Tax=Methanobrevibacter cuticularis TaxID=47311 RepID=A0A166D0T7_9EURY|nr:4Fe-4S binding protein [Methanobrevibacter cuticularis]KZX15079.1 putative electron transport protein YccM [Methanobrevibacter cuticularis]